MGWIAILQEQIRWQSYGSFSGQFLFYHENDDRSESAFEVLFEEIAVQGYKDAGSEG